MKRDSDANSELPLSSSNWQRFNKLESDASSISQSVSCSRTSGFMTHSECGDSLSNASASLTRNDEDDDERSSRIRESLKRELKQI